MYPWSVLAQSPGQTDLLAEIQARGSLVVGVKTDYPPFGSFDASGTLVGYDIDAARAIAEDLGVALELQGVTSANRLQKLVAGEVDVVIATLGDSLERRKLVAMVEPHYYGGGANVLLRPETRFASWAELRGHTLCAVQGAVWNRPLVPRLLLKIEAFEGTRGARLALQDGRCVGWLFDEVALQYEQASEEFADYQMPLPATMVLPWAIAVAPGAETDRLRRQIGDLVAEWHRTGWLQALEQTHGLPPSSFLTRMAAQWTARDEAGDPVCRRSATGHWPLECIDSSLATSEAVSGIAGLSLRLRDLTGLDISLLYDAFDRARFGQALLLTLGLCLFSVAGSIGFGLGAGWLMHRRLPILAPLLQGFGLVTRMTPPLLQLYLVFFGFGGLLAVYGLTINAFLAAVLVFSLYAGAANAVAFAEAAAVATRGGPPLRATLADLGRGLRLAFGTFMGSSVNIVKATGMASTIALPELVHVSTAIVAERGNTVVMMNLLMICYVVIVLAVVSGFHWLQKRLELPS
ncbi:MAG: transporter substrate-binding domain-containing protein [Rhodospirillaceae bacterium]